MGACCARPQNWVGGSWYHPIAAAYVPLRPALAPALMEDLVRLVNDARLPGVAVAAIAHAQMETVHPFADGNGRAGRALVHVILGRRGLCEGTVAPISLVLATMREQYVSALAAYRYDESDAASPGRDEVVSQWVEFFAFVTVLACERALSFEEGMEEIRQGWNQRVRPRGGSATALLLDVLLGNPVVSIASAARLTGRSTTKSPPCAKRCPTASPTTRST